MRGTTQALHERFRISHSGGRENFVCIFSVSIGEYARVSGRANRPSPEMEKYAHNCRQDPFAEKVTKIIRASLGSPLDVFGKRNHSAY